MNFEFSDLGTSASNEHPSVYYLNVQLTCHVIVRIHTPLDVPPSPRIQRVVAPCRLVHISDPLQQEFIQKIKSLIEQLPMLVEIKLRFSFYWNNFCQEDTQWDPRIEYYLEFLLDSMATAQKTFSQASNPATLSIDLYPKRPAGLPSKMLICVRLSSTSPKPACQVNHTMTQLLTLIWLTHL